MKYLILASLLFLSTFAFGQTANQWEIRKYTSSGMNSFWITGENSKAFGLNGSGVPAMLSISSGSTTLAGLTDVALSGLANSDLLRYNSGTAKWENVPGSTYALTTALTDYLTTATAASTYAPLVSPTFTTSINSGTSFTAFAGATTLLTLGGTGATATVSIPGTEAATGNSTAGALIVAGGVYVGGDAWINTVRVGRGGGLVSSNTAIGNGAMDTNGSGGTLNVAIGQSALNQNVTGDANTAVGYSALRESQSGSFNTAIGSGALQDSTGDNNIGIGYRAGYNSNATSSLFISSIDRGSSGGDQTLSLLYGTFAAAATDQQLTVNAGTLNVDGGTTGGKLALRETNTNGENVTGFIAPSSLAVDVIYTLPTADGTNGQALVTNGSGTLSFATISSGATLAANTFTGNQTINGTLDVTGAFGPAIERQLCTPNYWLIPWDGWGAQTVSGSGSISASGWGLNCQTGATASSRAQRTLSTVVADFFWGQPNIGTQQINWAKRFTVGFSLNPISSSTNGQWFIRFGDNASTSGNLSGRGVGLRMNNGAIVAQVHDGTTLNTSSTLKTVTLGTNQTTWVVIQSDGAGNVQFWIDNSLAVTLTGGPTAAATSVVAVESLNNADSSSTRVHLSPLKVFLTP